MSGARGQSWRLGPYQAVGYDFVVEGYGGAEVRLRLEHALAPLSVDPAVSRNEWGVTPVATPRAVYAIEPMGDPFAPTFRLTIDREELGSDLPPSYAAGLVLWHVNQRVIGRERGARLLLHAAGAERDGVVVLILGQSGHGKTTTVASLLGAGYRYLTDEAVVLNRESLMLTPFPKALALNRDSARLVGSPPTAADPQGYDTVWHVPWWDLGGQGVCGALTPGLIILLRPDADRERSTRLTPGQTAVELAEGTFGFQDAPRANLRALAAVASEAPGYAVPRMVPRNLVAEIDALMERARPSVTRPVARRIPTLRGPESD